MDQVIELLNQILSLAKSHAWVPLASVLIGVVIRISKDDRLVAWIPFTIPPKYRAWAALGGGVIVGVLDAIVAGQPLVTALVNGLIAAMIAISGHEAVVEGVRNGRDIGVKKGSVDDPAMSVESLSQRPLPR